MSKHSVNIDMQKTAQYIQTIRHFLDKLEVIIQESLIEDIEKEKK